MHDALKIPYHAPVQSASGHQTSVISWPLQDAPIGVLAGASSAASSDAGFEQLLSRVASALFNVHPDQADARIRQRLKEVVEWSGVDRALLVQFQPHNHMRVTHFCSVPGFAHTPPLFPDGQLPWIAATLRNGGIVRISRLSELPAEATRELEWARRFGVNAHLSIPCQVGGMPLCALSVSSRAERDWPDAMVFRLKLLAEVFASALARKAADIQLQQTREEVAHMARVSTIGQLASSLAHEINQPLCAILTNAQVALDFLDRPEADRSEIRAALLDVIHDTRRAGEIVARSHSLMKRHSVDYTPQDLNKLADDVKMILASYAVLRHTTIDLSLGDVPNVLGHGVQMQQVMINLAVNAIDATQIDASIPGLVTLSTTFDATKHQVLVRVRDNGAGLAPEIASRIFEPFYSTKPKGLGMGLAISRTIIEAHGGRLWFERNPDRGMTFIFALPAQRLEASHDDRNTDGACRR